MVEAGTVMVKVELLDTAVPVTTVTAIVPGVLRKLAATEAVNWVALTKAVVRGVPFQRIVEFDAKLEPLTVRVKAGPPVTAVVGLRLLTAEGCAAVTVKVEVLDADPDEFTVIRKVPCVAIKLAGTVAVNWLALTKVVARDAPFHSTVELEVKPEPLTVSVSADPAAVVVEGLRLVMVGSTVGVAVPVTVKVKLLDAVPLAATVMSAVPAEAMRVAGMEAVNWAELTKVVGRAEPFQKTAALAVKPDP
jgi:hypothetical protein